ncbi:hypothetical protein BT69DRAFT_1278977 [Atractiella rhizophila]|nr:hypothetical protein BT69DRAFT_1278977 [Atractiella rhizophila]
MAQYGARTSIYTLGLVPCLLSAFALAFPTPSNTASPLFLIISPGNVFLTVPSKAGGEASIDPLYRNMAEASDLLKVAGWESDLRSLPERSR